jgi:tRNA 2-selenouridine synthase
VRVSEVEVVSGVPQVSAPALQAALLAQGAERPVVIDLRSRAEYAEDCVPGAVHVPLFDDVERALIGTLYRRVAPAAAFEEGRRAARAGVAELVRQISQATGWEPPAVDLGARVEELTAGGMQSLEQHVRGFPGGVLAPDAVVLCCWRGGLRSRSVAALLRGLGLERAQALAGGYKAWRAHVRAGLLACALPPAIVLRGYTGVGKTLVLRELEHRSPGLTVDLEALAGHRSSVLGMVGLKPCSQKAFESRLHQRFEQGFPAGVGVFEGESRKVGNAILPQRVWDALESGLNLLLEASNAERASVLVADYLADEEQRPELRAQLPFLEQRMGSNKYRGVLTGLLDAHRDRELAELLLERYYDPLYAHSERGREYAATFDAADPARCAADILRWIEERYRP